MSAPRLYDLLPEIYRLRDAQTYDSQRAKYEAVRRGTIGADAVPPPIPPVKALFGVLQQLYDQLENEIGALYDDWFVETCRPQMLALLAEPLAIKDVIGLQRGGADIRALVANIVGYRQRKGTSQALAGMAHDVTGWAVEAVDGLRSTAANMRVDDSPFLSFYDVRNGAGRMPSATRTVRRSFTVRSTTTGLRTVQLNVWRMQAFFTAGVQPGQDPLDGRRRTISALGHDKVMMRPAHLGDGAESGSFFAVPLTRSDARREIAGGGLSYVKIVRSASPVPVEVADLSAWEEPARPAPAGTVYLDPELGRLLTPDTSESYRLDCFTADYQNIGASVPSKPWSGAFESTIVVSQSGDALSNDYVLVSSLSEAFAVASIAPIAAEHVRIVLADSRTHRPVGDAWTFEVSGRIKTLSIESGADARPTIEGELHFTAADDQRVVLLRGLNMRANVCCSNVRLIVDTCTIHSPQPGQPGSHAIEAAVNGITASAVSIGSSIIGDCAFGSRVAVTVQDSIVMGTVAGNAQGNEPDLTIRRSTLLSPVTAASIHASDSLFDAPLHVRSAHRGYLRYCAVRPGSVTPQRYHCYETARQLLSSTVYGKLHFARLRDDAPPQVREGAGDECEIGAFNTYAYARREANLIRIFHEFLPEGVGSRVNYES